MALHPLSYAIGVINTGIWLLVCACGLISWRQWKAHRASSRQMQAAGRSAAVKAYQIGRHSITLPLLMRACIVVCAWTGIVAFLPALGVSYMQLEPQDDALADISLLHPSYAQLSPKVKL